MMKQVASFFSGIRSRVMPCPSCRQRVRIPIKMGKTLRITCPNCRRQFEVAFQNPLASLFRFDRNKSIPANIRQLALNYQRLPGQAKLTVWFFLLAILLFIYSLVGPTLSTSADGDVIKPPSSQIEI